jgi:hypothetical protein
MTLDGSPGGTNSTACGFPGGPSYGYWVCGPSYGYWVLGDGPGHWMFIYGPAPSAAVQVRLGAPRTARPGPGCPAGSVAFWTRDTRILASLADQLV